MKNFEEKFWSKVQKPDDLNKCWLWIGNLDSRGRAQFHHGSIHRLAHRISWDLAYGRAPENKAVMHRCHQILCVNPDHLYLGFKANEKTTPEVFWRKFNMNGPVPPLQPELGPCWIWGGAFDEKGYGMTSINYVQMRVHRAAWEFANGPIPDGLGVLHKCDTPQCGRPDHLFLGTHADNCADKVAKGRQPRGEKHRLATMKNRPKGSNHVNSKLTEEKVRVLRLIWNDRRRISWENLGILCGVSHVTIYQIVSGRRWKHVA